MAGKVRGMSPFQVRGQGRIWDKQTTSLSIPQMSVADRHEVGRLVTGSDGVAVERERGLHIVGPRAVRDGKIISR